MYKSMQIKARLDPSAEEESGHMFPALTKNLSAFEIKIYFTPVESHWVYYPHLRASRMSSSRWTTQNNLNGIFVYFLSHIFCLGFLS